MTGVHRITVSNINRIEKTINDFYGCVDIALEYLKVNSNVWYTISELAPEFNLTKTKIVTRINDITPTMKKNDIMALYGIYEYRVKFSDMSDNFHFLPVVESKYFKNTKDAIKYFYDKYSESATYIKVYRVKDSTGKHSFVILGKQLSYEWDIKSYMSYSQK